LRGGTRIAGRTPRHPTASAIEANRAIVFMGNSEFARLDCGERPDVRRSMRRT
jgi:hypothetical protein